MLVSFLVPCLQESDVNKQLIIELLQNSGVRSIVQLNLTHVNLDVNLFLIWPCLNIPHKVVQLSSPDLCSISLSTIKFYHNPLGGPSSKTLSIAAPLIILLSLLKQLARDKTVRWP